MNYNALGVFMAQYGLTVALLIICVGLIFVIFAYGFWLLCLIDAFKRDESEFKDRTLWISILLISLFIPGVIWQVVAAFIYWAMYRPNLNF